MSVDQRHWWDRGDSARMEDERQDGGAFAVDDHDLESALVDYLDEDLRLLTESERADAVEAAVHGYREGREGGYGQPSWLDAHAGQS